MSAQMSILVSDKVNQELEQIAAQQRTTKSVIFQKALRLYLAASDGAEQGLRLVLVDPEEHTIKVEIIGL